MQKRSLIGLGVLVHRHLSDSDNTKPQVSYGAVPGRMKPETVGLFITPYALRPACSQHAQSHTHLRLPFHFFYRFPRFSLGVSGGNRFGEDLALSVR